VRSKPFRKSGEDDGVRDVRNALIDLGTHDIINACEMSLQEMYAE
jgi:hypothetical protein